MNWYKLVFSPTGGTQKIADALSLALGAEAKQVDLTDAGLDFSAYCFGAEDVCIVALPSFGGRAPAEAIARLSRMRGGQARAILVCAYGNRDFEDSLLEMRDCLQNAGFRPNAAIAAIAEHSIMRVYAAGRPHAQDFEELEGFARQIEEKLKSDAEFELELPGNTPYKSYKGVPMKPAAGNKCVQCGLCAARCPVKAIPEAAPNETDKDKCITCMRCVSLCPSKARGVNPVMLALATQALKAACSTDKPNRLFL